MAIDYTVWPTVAQVQAKAKGLGLEIAEDMDMDYVQQVVDSVVAEIEQECRRNFVGVVETRYFDGSGRGEQEVDEYIDITAVEILGYFGSVAGMSLTDWWEPETKKHPKTRIQIYQGSQPTMTRIYVGSFPFGRSNIKVTGTWGYAPTIPANIWGAVLDYAACVLAAESMYSQSGGGFKAMWKEADVMEQVLLLDPRKFLPHMQRIRRAIKQYRKPTGKYLRRALRKQIV